MVNTFFHEHDGLLCDLDGVVYKGQEAVPGAIETLQQLSNADIPVVFVTNNASRSPQTVAKQLSALGLGIDSKHVITSAQAAVQLLGEHAEAHNLESPRCYVIGTEYLHQCVRESGFEIVENAESTPEYFIQGLNPQLQLEDLAQGAFSVSAGAYWIATNMDKTFPRAEGLAPGNGSLVDVVATVAGHGPDAVGGKPGCEIFRLAAQRFNMQNPLMVGDRLDTDVAGGIAAGVETALVLTGVHDKTHLEAVSSEERPDYVLETLQDLVARV